MAAENFTLRKMLVCLMLWTFCLPLWAQTACPVVVEPRVDVSGDLVTLADLLSAGTCVPLRQAASSIRLGSSPQPGSPRVLAGAEVQQLLRLAMEKTNGAIQPYGFRVPERVVMRRAGARASCVDIGSRMSAESRLQGSGTTTFSSLAPGDTIECGAEGRIFQTAALDFIPPVWDARLRQWRIVGRCKRAGDCVPFLVFLPNLSSLPEDRTLPSHTAHLAQAAARSDNVIRKPEVRAGQKVLLVWDQGGLRLVVPAISVGAGFTGESVRARLPNGEILPAKIEGASLLRATSEPGQDQ